MTMLASTFRSMQMMNHGRWTVKFDVKKTVIIGRSGLPGFRYLPRLSALWSEWEAVWSEWENVGLAVITYNFHRIFVLENSVLMPKMTKNHKEGYRCNGFLHFLYITFNNSLVSNFKRYRRETQFWDTNSLWCKEVRCYRVGLGLYALIMAAQRFLIPTS